MGLDSLQGLWDKEELKWWYKLASIYARCFRDMFGIST